MTREKWTKKSSRKSDTSSVDGNDRKWEKPAQNNRTERQPSSPRLVAGIDMKAPPPCVPKPTRTICDLASKQNWAEALQRCQTHPQDMDYADVLTEREDPLWSEILTLFIVMIKMQLKLDRSINCFYFYSFC